MKMNEDIRPVTYLKSRSADLLAQINETHRPVIITQNGEARGVLQDPESYENMRAAIGLLKLVALGEEDVRSGRIIEHDEVFARLEKIAPWRIIYRIAECRGHVLAVIDSRRNIEDILLERFTC